MKRQSMCTRNSQRSVQRGVTLIVVLLILVIVTVLGIGGAQIALLGERSTRNDRDYLIASQAAEAGLVDGELDIDGTPHTGRVDSFVPNNLAIFVPACGTTLANLGLCERALPGSPNEVWQTPGIFTAAPSVPFGAYTGRVFAAGNSGIRSFQSPRYIIEVVEDRTPGIEVTIPPPVLYRITAVGFGPRKGTEVAVQSIYRKRLPQ